MQAAIPAAVKSGAKRILEIRLKVGELSGVIPACVEEYFSMLSEGTIAEGAAIVSETIPASIECRDCGWSGPMDRKLRISMGTKRNSRMKSLSLWLFIFLYVTSRIFDAEYEGKSSIIKYAAPNERCI